MDRSSKHDPDREHPMWGTAEDMYAGLEDKPRKPKNMDRNNFFTAAMLSLSAAMGFFALALIFPHPRVAPWLLSLSVISAACFLFFICEFAVSKR